MNLTSLFDVLRAQVVGPRETIHFHVGVHKTATTYMQSRLRTNRQHLRTAGVDFVDLWARRYEETLYRKEFNRVIGGAGVDDQETARVAKQLGSIVADGRSAAKSLVVISYENLLGDYDLTRSPTPYPNAERAILHLVEAFAGWNLKIFISIRSLDRFVESGYVQRVVSRRETRTFKQYVNHIDLSRMSWMPVIRAIGSVVGRENVVVWEYENFVLDEQPIWNALLALPDAESALVLPAKINNYSLSAKGLKYMRCINKVATRADARKFRSLIRDGFGSQLGFEPPTLLDDVRRQQLTSNYERDRVDLVGTTLCDLDKNSEAARR